MGDEVMNQPQAWQTYDRWLQDDRVAYLDEPSGFERIFRNLTRLAARLPKTGPIPISAPLRQPRSLPS